MGRRISLIVNYKNSLGLWHIAVEQLMQTEKNYFITPEDFASWVAEIYLKKGCSDVVCIEWLSPKTSKAALKNLAECDAGFITDEIKDKLGRRWSFTTTQPEVTE